MAHLHHASFLYQQIHIVKEQCQPISIKKPRLAQANRGLSGPEGLLSVPSGKFGRHLGHEHHFTGGPDNIVADAMIIRRQYESAQIRIAT